MLGRWHPRLGKGFFLFVELPVVVGLLVATTIAAALGDASWVAPVVVFLCLLSFPLEWRAIKRRERQAR